MPPKKPTTKDKTAGLETSQLSAVRSVEPVSANTAVEKIETIEMDGPGSTSPAGTVQHTKNSQPPQLMHWFFTWNNFSRADVEIIETTFREFCYKYVFQHEIGTKTATPHLQGVISCKKRRRWTEFGLPKEIHWEKPRNLTECYEYCSRASKRHPDHPEDYWPYNFERLAPLKLLNPSQFYPWQKTIMNIINTDPNDRDIYWYWSDKGGIGKSTFIKYLCACHNAILCVKGRYSDICNLVYKAKNPRLVIFDLPRANGNSISYDALESIKNGIISNTKYETGTAVFNSPHILIFANEPPVEDKLSQDRWKITCLDDHINAVIGNRT